MKKIALFAILLATAYSIKAQDTDPRFTIGTRGGFGHSSITPEGGHGFNSSWFIGLTTNYMFREHWGFGADALYSSEGGSIRLSDGLLRNAEIDYLRVPLRLSYFFGKMGNELRPRIALAPTFGINMANGTSYKDMDFGFLPSAGLNYEMLEEFWVGVDLSYYLGMSDIYAGTSAKEQNRNLRLEVSLTFGL